MTDPTRRPPAPPGGDDEPVDLEEVRAARALAEALDGAAARGGRASAPGTAPGIVGRTGPGAELAEALRGAALVASARVPDLSDAARHRIADELFGPAGDVSAEARGRDVSAEAPGRDVSAEARGRDVSAETRGRDVSAEAPGQDVSAEAPGRDVSAETRARDVSAGTRAPERELRPVRVRRWPVPVAIAAGLAAVVGAGLLERTAARMEAPPVATPAQPSLRGEASELLAGLLPPGGSPTGRARVVVARAAARQRQALGGLP